MSVYVKFDPWGRMGNRMFQYAFGFLLAQKKKTEFYSPELPNFNKINTTKTLPNDYIKTSQYGNNYVDNNELLNTTKDIVIDSFVQKASYYTPHVTELRNLFNIKENLLEENHLALHIRETDYKDLNCFLGYEFYKKIINKTGFTNIIIVTDNSNCETVQKLIAEGCKLHTEGCVDKFEHFSNNRSMQDFYFLLNSKNIAISQSSFSWWAAFLGFHENIYFPYISQKGMWETTPEKDDIDLFYHSEKTHKLIL